MSDDAPTKKIICCCGIDPGSRSGAVAFYFPSHPDLITVEDLPTMDGEIDTAELARRIEQMRPDFAMVEKVSAMPKQGVSSSFNFGFGCGQINGVIGALKIPVHYVSPSKWKKALSLDSDAEKSRAAAIRLWPSSDSFSRKKDHNKAEAALLAKYGADTILREAGE